MLSSINAFIPTFDEIINGDMSSSIGLQPGPGLSSLLEDLVAPGSGSLPQQLVAPPNPIAKHIPINIYFQPTLDPIGDASELSWLQVGDSHTPDTERSKPKTSVTQKRETIESKLTKKLLIGQLFNYLNLMNSSRLPPFIFTACKQGEGCGLNGSHQCLLRPLENCRAIITMAENIATSNKGFVWAVVENEVLRLYKDLSNMDCYEVQASLQACTIYALLYARYIRPVQAGGVLSVIKAIIDFGRHLHSMHDFRSPLGPDESAIRQEWILREGTRRTICVLYGIELLLDVFKEDPDHVKCRGLENVPLPCTRDLWEPVPDPVWIRRYQNSVSLQHGVESMCLGTIQSSIFLLNGRSTDVESKQSDSHEAISRWCEEADELGTLVWMTILVETR
ncbi:hypothetical protein TRIATDRAFT_316706 [Trichoderma atroviride IMI 206040]|uniref:Transcription factor domain-containing protein n=1 Tax=Hypocrea atroviridis (strain ATCC 20476 / IMI 206040) TaxID=452589 RepID=G9NNN1_HYPAI|nr:uncharacterized protein TRIATDRAFT_316706 [Trichoderma atroviride IMI 206040]EHK47674.1 hypothetical protein TRIATDRAFT_316706 [Trichoderma atroviride IMI 206040]